HRLERLVFHAEWKHVDVFVERRRAMPQLLGCDEDQVGPPEHRLLARRDPPRLGRARREIVDAVVDEERRIELVDQRMRERRPRAASVDMISWCPCQMKSQSIDEMQSTSDAAVTLSWPAGVAGSSTSR